MKTNAIIRIVIYSLVILLLLGMLAVGLGVGRFMFHIDSGSGKSFTGEGSINAADIDSLEIEWASGTIKLQTADTDTVSFAEEGQGSEDERMVYSISGRKLKIQYREPSVQIGFFSTSLSKDLIITVPADWVCDSLDIDSASTDVTVENLTIDAVDLDTASNSIRFLNCKVGELSVDGASNSIYMDGTLDSLDCDGMSASLTAVLTNVPQQIDIDGMSSELDLTLPENCGFRVTMEGLSNDFSSDYQTASDNGSYIYGDQQCRIDIDGMSSTVTIRKGK